MFRLTFWNLSVFVLTGIIAILHIIHLALLNHLDFIQQHTRKTTTTAQYILPEEEAKKLFVNLETALKNDEILDSSGTYRISTRISRSRKETTNSIPTPEVTLVTHSTYHHLQKIIAIAHHWQGPISVAVYANTNDMGAALWKIASLMACDHDVRSYVSFTMVSHVPAHSSPPLEMPTPSPFGTCSFDYYEDPSPLYQSPIPVNILRNAARRGATSEFVLVVDIDMIPSENLHQDFLRFASQRGLYKRHTSYHKSVFVVPTFEAREDAEVPLNKEHLLSLLDTGEVRPYFSEICRKCQERTSYDAWLKDPIGNEMTPLTTVYWKDPWEPFYIARNNVPFYDERFQKHGYNRISHMCELHVSGYVFSVMKKSFLIHRGFKTLESFHLETESEQKNDLMLFRQFKAELKVKYMHSPRKC